MATPVQALVCLPFLHLAILLGVRRVPHRLSVETLLCLSLSPSYCFPAKALVPLTDSTATSVQPNALPILSSPLLLRRSAALPLCPSAALPLCRSPPLRRSAALTLILPLQVSTEIHAHSCVNHPNIIQLLMACEDSQHVYIILEHAEGGDLSRHRFGLSEVKLRDWIVAPLLQALASLHAQVSLGGSSDTL